MPSVSAYDVFAPLLWQPHLPPYTFRAQARCAADDPRECCAIGGLNASSKSSRQLKKLAGSIVPHLTSACRYADASP